MSEAIELNLTRKLQFQKAGKNFSGTLRISRLEKIGENKWVCYWSCDYFCEAGHLFGEDALHALTNCLKVVGDLLRDAAKEGLSVWWKSPGDGCWLGSLPVK